MGNQIEIYKATGRNLYYDFSANDTSSDTSSITRNFSGCHFYGPYIGLSEGRYRAVVKVDVLTGSAKKLYADVCTESGAVVEQSSYSLMEEGSRAIIEVNFNFSVRKNKVEVRIFSSSALSLQFIEIIIYKECKDFAEDFVFLVKSYSKDLEWSYYNYLCAQFLVTPSVNFYLIVPENDIQLFIQRFLAGMLDRQLRTFPLIISEEYLLSRTGQNIPPDFTGWHIQQIVKLCFSKTKIARNYCTLDSSMLFSKQFNWRSELFREGQIVTAAQPFDREERNQYYRGIGEKGWLFNRLVNISESFEFIENYFGNKSSRTHHYIATNGFFSSELASELEEYALSKGIDGFVGLISVAPYEFAWYGSYVANIREEMFSPRDPAIMLAVIDEQAAIAVMDGSLEIPECFFGITFQIPASELTHPLQVVNNYLKVNIDKELLPSEVHINVPPINVRINVSMPFRFLKMLSNLRLYFHGDDKSACQLSLELNSVPERLHIDYSGIDHVSIGDGCSGNYYFRLFGDCQVYIGSGTSCEGLQSLVNPNGQLVVGNDCMLSDQIVIFCGDNHAIIDLDTRDPLNLREKPVVMIGDYVWVGFGAKIIADTNIGSGSVVGAASVVKGNIPCYSLIVGNPAKIKRNNISWTRSYWGVESDIETLFFDGLSAPK